MKQVFFLCMIVGFHHASGQVARHLEINKRISIQLNDMSNGSPITVAKYAKISSGSAYFNDEWVKADVNITDSTVANNLMVRLDLLDGSLEYKTDNKSQEQICTIPVHSVEVIDNNTLQKLLFVPSSRIDKNGQKTWYQVLSEGENMTLFKEIHKELFENTPYGSQQSEKEIRTSERYLVLAGNNLVKVKKFSDIISAAGNKGEALQKYINSNNLSAKREGDLIKLINYYHTLK